MKPILAIRLNSLRVGLMIALCAESGASAATIHVSGGGATLNDTITGAVGGDEIIVDDSLDYAPVSISKQLFIHAATGQTPRVVADPTVASGQAVGVNGAGVNGFWGGINIVQNVAGGGGGHNVIG